MSFDYEVPTTRLAAKGVMLHEGQVRDMFVFLDDLRESGETNMFGASWYLVQAFDYSPRECRKVLGEWMTSFSERHPAHISA